MRKLFKVRSMFLVLSLALASYGCGKDSGSNNSGGTATVATTPGVCPSGQVWINQANGCVSNGSCGANYGFYNSQCVIGSNQYGNQYGQYGQYGNQYGQYGQQGYTGGGSLYGSAYYGNSGYFPYNQGGSNMGYYSPSQNNCRYSQNKWGFYYYICN